MHITSHTIGMQSSI